jgi:hypothetical protein
MTTNRVTKTSQKNFIPKNVAGRMDSAFDHLRVFRLAGGTGFEQVTSSVSVQGSYLAGSHDLAVGGSGGEPMQAVVCRRCCHFCCH